MGGDDDGGDKEKDEEEERLRQEAIKEAEEKRRIKHKKMEEERENMRQGIRDKVSVNFSDVFVMMRSWRLITRVEFNSKLDLTLDM